MSVETPNKLAHNVMRVLPGLGAEGKKQLIDAFNSETPLNNEQGQKGSTNDALITLGASSELMGYADAILKDLKDNHVKIEENTEMMGYKGKKVHIDLPVVGDFKGFKFDYFVSDGLVTKEDFNKKSEFKEQSYSIKEVAKLLEAMNKYMKAYGVSMDENVDFNNELIFNKTYNYRCDTGDCLKKLLELDRWYWMKNEHEKGNIAWSCRLDDCCFNRIIDGLNRATLFLKLSD